MNGRTLPVLASGVGAIIVSSLYAIDDARLRAALGVVSLVVIYLLGYFHDRKRDEQPPGSA